MKNVQTIRTPAGDELVVLPKADYEALVAAASLSDDDEDAADAAMYDLRKAALHGGSDPILPAEVSGYMLVGDSLFRALRKWRGLTQEELSASAGLSQSFLSSIERQTKTCTGETQTAIAGALDVPEEWLK